MIPMTVPKRPMKGALFPTVPRYVSHRSSTPRSIATALCIDFSIAAGPSAASWRPAAATAAATDLVLLSASAAAAKLRRMR